MKKLMVVLLLVGFQAQAIHFFDVNGASVGQNVEIQCGQNLNCSLQAGKMRIKPPDRIQASTTALTAAACGSTIFNAGAVEIVLPAASGNQGCRLNIITANATSFDVNPAGTDQILILTNAAGDRISNLTLGNSVMLEVISATQWAPVGKEQGTYFDIN